MKLLRLNSFTEVTLIHFDGASKFHFLALDFSFCNNYYNLEQYVI